MKLSLVVFLFVSLTVTTAWSHPGRTDKNGCHSGTQPYHCHNSKNKEYSASTEAWDINAGYQFSLSEQEFEPFLGASIGKNDAESDVTLGVNLGVKFHNGIYAGYASTSKSLQLGYEFIHLSINSGSAGIGIRFPFGAQTSNSYPVFYSGSILFSSDE